MLCVPQIPEAKNLFWEQQAPAPLIVLCLLAPQFLRRCIKYLYLIFTVNVEISLFEGCHGWHKFQHSKGVRYILSAFQVLAVFQVVFIPLPKSSPFCSAPVCHSCYYITVSSEFPLPIGPVHPIPSLGVLLPCPTPALPSDPLCPASSPQPLTGPWGQLPALSGCMSSQQLLPFPLWFKVFSQQPGFQTPSYEFCFILPSRQTCFSFWLLVPFHHPGKPVPLQSLCACQLTCCRPSSHLQCVFQGAFCCFPRGLEGQVHPSYLQTWHGPEQPGTGAAGPAVIPQPWAAMRTVLLEWKCQEAPAKNQQDFQDGFHSGVWGSTSDKVTALIFRAENPWQKEQKEKCLYFNLRSELQMLKFQHSG